ncbi:sensor histidine kinase [Aeromicrobium fastidiosum]|uniref:histidine kinase n=1 Tax=Aeromicrobium fastidiosum TaxID=52699 RepID=A0A641AQE1_9ACTN|nr:histidine kinase [Aeromicrobium fastidiosum]KAA1378617.1 sensor histidine kinase [Aeromicrobium fastidiosum]MBP2392404.1 signal transduction histidine kinase [Aeromicrobium fastidiosum]
MLDLDRPWARPAPDAGQVRADVIGGVVAAIASVVSVEVWRSGAGITISDPVLVYALFAVAGLLFAGRRRFPLTTLLLESIVFIVIGEHQAQLGVVFTLQIVLFVALYSAWAWSRRPRALLVTSAVVVVAMFGWLVWQFVREDPPTTPSVGLLPPYGAMIAYSLAINVIYFFGAMAWGHGAWRSARQRAEIAERVVAERHAQDRDRESAVQAERVRIARDLHDVVAHHVSGIGVQAAGAGRVLDARPEVAREALSVIETSSRQAVQQMHQLVGLLRADDERGDRVPQPGLPEIATLASPDDRPSVAFRQVGEPFDVAPTVALSMFRIAQEAVANLRRHAGACSGEIVLRFVEAGESEPATVEVEVIDDGSAPVSGPAPTSSSGGFGLTGIRERAAMHGGEAEIGSRPDGGFRVRVRIPVAT